MKKYTLDEIIREYYIELGKDQIDRSYGRFLQNGLNGLRDIYQSFGMNQIIKEVEVDIEDNDIVILPSDYVDYRKIYLSKNGQKLALGLNSNMPMPQPNDCGVRTTPQFTDHNGLYPFLTYTEFQNTFPTDYGVGSGRNYWGYYKIFPNEGYIAIQQGESFDSIFLEYVADFDTSDGNFYVHPYDIEPIKHWLYLCDIRFNKMVPANEKILARQTYQREKTRALKKHNAMTITEIVAAYKSGFMSAPKI
jgi:hypothetical protein